MPLWLRRSLLVFSCCLLGVSAARALTVPTGFTVDNMVPGTTFTVPTAVTFLPDGRYLVAEKGGTVRMVENNVAKPTAVMITGPTIIATAMTTTVRS